MSVDAGWHIPITTLAPEKGKNALGIDAVREVTEKLNEHARLGGAKVVWVTDAALLTDAAANALLKTRRATSRDVVFPCYPQARTFTGNIT